MARINTQCPDCKRMFLVEREMWLAIQRGDADALAQTCGRGDCQELARAIAVEQTKAISSPRRRRQSFPPELRQQAVPEKNTQAAILHYLAIRGIFAWRQNQGAMRMENKANEMGRRKRRDRFIRFAAVDGISDIIGIYKGRFLSIEVKKVGNKPTDHQRDFLTRVDKEGGIAIVAYSVDDVVSALADVDRGAR